MTEPTTTPYWRHHIKDKWIYRFVEKHIQPSPGEIISVGSGSAEIERYLSARLKRKIICVDPDPESFSKKDPLIYPRWNTVKNMIKAKAAPINSTLLLIWPAFCGYDLEAIKLLRPHEIFILYEEENRIAGSSALHDWLKSDDKEYTVHGVREWWSDMGMVFNHRLVYLQRDLPMAMKEVRELLDTQNHSKIALIGNYDLATIEQFENLCNLRQHYDINLVNRYIVVGKGMTVCCIDKDRIKDGLYPIGFRSRKQLAPALEQFQCWTPREYHNIVLLIDPSYDPTDLLNDEWTIIRQCS